jgi:hypothetical protein
MGCCSTLSITSKNIFIKTLRSHENATLKRTYPASLDSQSWLSRLPGRDIRQVAGFSRGCMDDRARRCTKSDDHALYGSECPSDLAQTSYAFHTRRQDPHLVGYALFFSWHLRGGCVNPQYLEVVISASEEVQYVKRKLLGQAAGGVERMR